MSDEQPGSWMFYEADLHTDRRSANKERSVAWNYRNLELCPAEVLPGFAMHQTDRDPTELEKTRGSGATSTHARAILIYWDIDTPSSRQWALPA